MILLIDNYDSFTYNLLQYIGEFEPDIKVIRNDMYSIAEIEEMSPDAVVISPGPGRPADAGICIEAIRYFKDKLPILGVCLGHQAICEAFGGVVSYAKELMHGKISMTDIVGDCPVFKGISGPVQVARYHSLAAPEEKLPEELEVTARTADGEVMAVQHKMYPVYGLQFHPESVLTPEGLKMIENFVETVKKGTGHCAGSREEIKK
ncbi:MAG: aminodeoxychorismate/anthranilate synthase component II [Eubacteriales bacterium]|nr:aminodeoxychorismate/anthranilate synthase component II [Eubacteriales bacterium]